MRKLVVIVAVSMVISLTGCGSSGSDGGKGSSSSGTPQVETQVKAQAGGDDPAPRTTGEFPEYHWTAAMSVAENTINYMMVEELAELLDERSGGRIMVDIYPGGQLGNTTEFTETVIGGSIDIGTGMTTDLVDFVPSYAAFDMPNLFADVEQMKAVLSGSFVSALDEYNNREGIEMLSFSDAGFRQLTSGKPVYQLADLSGQKVRVMTDQYHIAYWNALSATATPIWFTGVFMGPQQGTIDGEESPYMNIVGNNMQEVQKYVIEADHIGHIITFFMNYNLYQGLPEDVKVFVGECTKEATACADGKADENIAEYKKTCEDAGCEMIVLNGKVMGGLKEKASMVYDIVRENTSDKLVDQLLVAINEAK